MIRNCDLPGGHIYGYVRTEFLYDQQSGHGQFTPCAIYGIASRAGHALAFHVHLNNGASWAPIPLHALAWKDGTPLRGIGEIQAWDCFGDEAVAHRFTYLRDLRVRALGQLGRYVCTVDWLNNGYSDTPDQQKSAHLIALDDGNFAALPNNRVVFLEPSFVTSPLDTNPGYRVNSHRWFAEDAR